MTRYSACFQYATFDSCLSFYSKTVGYFEVILLRLLGIKFFLISKHMHFFIPQIEIVQLEPIVNLKETKRKRVETENHKSKRKKPNEYSENPKTTNGKPKELDKRNNSIGIKLNSPKGRCSKTCRKNQTALNTTCKVETEAVGDSDVLIIDDDKVSMSETSSIPGKLIFLPLFLDFLLLLLLFYLSLPLSFNTCSLQV